jgi:mannitol/fructose-specific phosphotransferase system IIA component (Ntr-type)
MNNNGFLLSDLLAPSTIRLNLRSNNRDDVLRELVSCIPEIANRPDLQQTLVRALEEREQLHSTGIGDGIALPHARNALVDLVEKPVIVLGRHPQGISFGAIDGQPARLFFLLIAPNVTQHLGMLARISRLLRDTKLRQNLLTVETPEKALALIREAEKKMLGNT